MNIGFIVDGNRRWAKSQGLPTIEGHRAGMKAVEMTIEELAKKGIEYASFYVFSTENWGRNQEEVDNLMSLAASQIERLAKKMAKNNIRLLVLGSKKRVEPSLLQKFRHAEDLTKDCTGLTACFCFNYGGQQELADAAKGLALAYKDAAHAGIHSEAGAPSPDDFFTPEHLAEYLYHPEIPPIDLVVRTSGEQRISGFMLWRISYAEFLFLDKLYPALTPADIDAILTEYSNRQRRFGK